MNKPTLIVIEGGNAFRIADEDGVLETAAILANGQIDTEWSIVTEFDEVCEKVLKVLRQAAKSTGGAE